MQSVPIQSVPVLVSYTPLPGGEAQGEHRHDGLQRAGVGHREQDAARLVSQLVGWSVG